MSEYIIAYLGGRQPASPEEGAKHMEKWKAWLGGLGDAVVNPGTPMKNSRIVSSDGVSEDCGPNVLTGFSIVQADSLDEALEMAKACPFLDIGTLQVSELVHMQM